MTRLYIMLSALFALCIATGCLREIGGTACPCLSGWICCESENVCKPEGASCAESSDATTSSGDSTQGMEDDCQGGREPATRVCPGGPFSASILKSQATLKALVGRWQVCGGTGFRWGPENAMDGIEFTSDLQFFLLKLDAQGALRRAVGRNAKGTYGVYGDLDNGVIAFNLEEQSVAILQPSFDAERRRFHAGADSGFDSDYVRVPPGQDAVAGVSAPGACRQPPEKMCVAPACPGGPFLFAEYSAEVTARTLVGRWQLCQGAGFSWEPPSARHGFELTNDGKFYALTQDAQGALKRAVGEHSEGSYQTGRGRDGSFVVSLLDAGFHTLLPGFDNGDAHMLLSPSREERSIYARVAPGADNVPGVTAPPATCDATGAANTTEAGGTCDGGMLECPGSPFTFSVLPSQHEISAAIVGRWQLCEGIGLRWGYPNALDGVEFMSDGTFYLLGHDERGALQRVADLHTTGTYRVADSEPESIVISFAEGGAAALRPAFDASKEHFQVGVKGHTQGTYVRVPAGVDAAHGVRLGSCGQAQ